MANKLFKSRFGESAIDFSIVKSYNIKDSFISLGSKYLNYIVTGHLDVGIVRGRIYEVYGTEGCGKTTLGLESIVSCQKKKGKAMFIDAEHSLDIDYAKRLKIDFNKLIFGQSDCGEEAFEMILWGMDNKYDLIVIDSVAAMTPIAEIEGDMDQHHMGLHPLLMGQGLRKVSNKLGARTPTALLFINQIRMKIGVMFGNPEVQPGGKALKFWADVRLELRDPRKLKIVRGGVEIGKSITAKTVKNKIYPPFKKCYIPIIYGEGINKARDAIYVLIDKKLATSDKNTVTLKGDKKSMNIFAFENRLKKDFMFRKRVSGLLRK